MKIGIDGSNLRAGGAVTHIVELLRAGDPREHGIGRVIVWGGRRLVERLPAAPWLEAVHEPLLDRSLPLRTYWQRIRLPRLAASACDLLFAPGGSAGNRFQPTVTMFRNMLPFDPPEMQRYAWSWIFWRLRILRIVQGRSFRGAAGVIFLNDFARDAVHAQLGPLTSGAVIPHGVTEAFRREPRTQRRIEECSPDAPFRLLYTSIIDLYKHQWNVAEAVLGLRRQGMPVAIDFVGPAYGPASQRVQAVLDRYPEVRGAVNIAGPAAHADLPAIHQRADGFVFASTCENMPNIVVEAMAAGLPVASSDRRPMPDILGDAAIYFDAENVGDIEQVLGNFVADADLRGALAHVAYHRALQYSWSRCASETWQYLARVAGAAHRL